MEQKSDEFITPEQQKYLLLVFPGIHKIISRRLGKAHRSSIEDIKQRVFLKLWRWKKEESEKNLSREEWQKLANVVARNEVTEFFREKYTRRDVLFSQMDEDAKTAVFSTESEEKLQGNTRAETCSQLKLVWKAAQTLTLRQKYTFFLQFRHFIIEFILCECCSIEELVRYFETNREELSRIIEKLPLSDDEIGRQLEQKLGEGLSPKQIWEARAKAKIKLAKILSGYISDERLFIQRRS